MLRPVTVLILVSWWCNEPWNAQGCSNHLNWTRSFAVLVPPATPRGVMGRSSRPLMHLTNWSMWNDLFQNRWGTFPKHLASQAVKRQYVRILWKLHPFQSLPPVNHRSKLNPWELEQAQGQVPSPSTPLSGEVILTFPGELHPVRKTQRSCSAKRVAKRAIIQKAVQLYELYVMQLCITSGTIRWMISAVNATPAPPTDWHQAPRNGTWTSTVPSCTFAEQVQNLQIRQLHESQLLPCYYELIIQ